MSPFGKVPVTVVTGFLGAGKTTLIRHLLEGAHGRRLALIINEFGDVGVDGDILRSCGIESCPEENIVELANGCLCCTVADDFVPAIEALLLREPRPDHIVVETSGLALPKPLVKAFDDLAARPSHHDAEAGHDHDDFDSFVLDVPALDDPQAFAQRLVGVADRHGVLRMKGFLAVAGKPMRLLVQGVGTRFRQQFDRPWAAGEARHGRLVVIGEKGLDRAAIAMDIGA